MRIAIFSEVYWPMVSGVSLSLMRLTDQLHRRGHEVRVFSPTYALPEGMADRPEVHRSPSRPLFLDPKVQWASPDRDLIRRQVAAFAPDVVHIATEAVMGHAGLRTAKALGLPIVMSAHTHYELYAPSYGLGWAMPAIWSYLRWFYSQAARVLAPSAEYERFLNARGIRHTGVWSRGVDTALFCPSRRSPAWREALGIPGDAPVVAYIGRVALAKEIGILLDAWERLGVRRRDAHLVLVGEGLMLDEIRARALPNAHFLPFQHGTALATAYASADIFAFPSSTETFGNVLLEAMAAGTACLAVDAGGVREFAHGGNALLVTPRDAVAFADGLSRLLHDAALRARLAAEGRATALSRSWDRVLDLLLDDYAEAADRRRIAVAA